MDLNIIDGALILIILLSVWTGYSRGLILGILTLVGWLGSLLLAFLLYPYVLRWVDGESASQSVWLVPIVFLVTFFVIRMILGLLINLILSGIPREAHESSFNRFLGIAPGLVNGLIYAAIIGTLLLIFPISDKVSAMARESKIANALSEPVAKVEEKISPVFEDVVKRTIGKMTVNNESHQTVKLHYTVKNPKPRPDLEARMLELVNAERIKHGLNPLKADPEMRVVARLHSVDMFARGYFSHNTPEGKDPFDRMRARKVRFLTAGENLALARNVVMAHEGLMNSPGHRANILQPRFGRVGIGILDGGIYGIMVTQNFRN